MKSLEGMTVIWMSNEPIDGVSMREIKVWNMLDQQVITEADIYRPRSEALAEKSHVSGQKAAPKGQGNSE